MSITNTLYQLPQTIIGNGVTTGTGFTNTDNLLYVDGELASSATGDNEASDVIVGNFNINLPQNATITGIRLKLIAQRGGQTVPPISVTPVLVNNLSGTNVYYPGSVYTGLTTDLEEHILGGETDLWGHTGWTPDEINNIKVLLVANGYIEPDSVLVQVFYYLTPTPLPPDPVGNTCENCNSTIEALPFTLARTMLSTDTTFLLKSFGLVDGTPITLAMLGDCGGEICITFDKGKPKVPGGNFQEDAVITSADGVITVLPNGFVEIDLGDITNRGLMPVTPYTYDADLLSDHNVGTQVIISNSGRYQSRFVQTCQAGTIFSAPITTQDEGDNVVYPTETFNFIGDNVQAEQDSIDPTKANITFVSNPTNVTPAVVHTSSGTNNATPSTTLTVAHTITTENYLRVGISTENETISGVTYDGVAMSLVASETDAGNDIKVAIYDLINPNAGTNDIIVTMANAVIITAIGTSYDDVDTSNPVDGISAGATGNSTSPSDTVTTTVQNTVIQDIVGTALNPSIFTQSGLWTIQGDETISLRPGACSTRKVLIPQAVTDTYTLTTATNWVIIMAGVRGNTAPVITGQIGIQFQDEGVNLGTAGTVDEVDFTGAGVTATRVGNKVTVDIPGGGGGTLNTTSGVFARAIDAVSNVQTIAHGLGTTPSKVFITADLQTTGGNGEGLSFGTYKTTGSLTNCIYSGSGGSTYEGNSTTDIVKVYYSGNIANGQTATITVDATNITLTWTKVGAAGGSDNIQILWETENGTGGGSGVQSVTGLDTDNTDPANPIVQIAVDGVTITGDGTPGNPLVSVGGGGGGGTKIAVDTTQSVVTASSTTDIYTIPIPGGTLGTNNAIRLKVLLSHLRDDVSVAVALKYGGTTIATGTLNGSGFSGNGWIEGTIVANNATNAQKGDIAILGSNNPVTIDSLVSEYGTSAVDSSISQNLVLTVTTGGGNSALTAESIIVESIGGTGSGSSGTLLSIKNGTTTYDTSTASGTQTIAHGLGEVPISVSLKATLAYNPTTNLASIAQANTTYNGTTQSSNSTFHQSVNGAGQQSIDGSTFVIYQDNVPTNYVTGTVTFDANNIYIAWVKTGTNTGTAEILWQAEAGGGGNGNKFIGVGETTNINWFNGELSFVQLDGGTDAWTIANPSGVLTESKTDLTTNTTCSIGDWCVDWATGGVLNFNSGKQVIVQGIVVYDAVDDKCGWGFGDAIWNAQGAANNNFGFVTDAAGAFYTYTGAVGGVTYTETPITSLSSGTHVLRIEVDPANATPQIRFYVDGALVSTHTTNVATTESLDFSLGNSGGAMNGILAVSSPTFAVEI